MTDWYNALWCVNINPPIGVELSPFIFSNVRDVIGSCAKISRAFTNATCMPIHVWKQLGYPGGNNIHHESGEKQETYWHEYIFEQWHQQHLEFLIKSGVTYDIISIIVQIPKHRIHAIYDFSIPHVLSLKEEVHTNIIIVDISFHAQHAQGPSKNRYWQNIKWLRVHCGFQMSTVSLFYL